METKNTKSTSIGTIPIWLILILLKAFGYVSLSWLWVFTFPIWFSIIMWLVVVGFLFLMGVIAVLIGKR